MPLSDTQILILTTAAQRPDGIAAPPASLPSAPRAAVAKALLRAGLLAPDEAGHADPNSAWKLDGTMVVLRITEAGLRAVGVGPQGRAAALGEAIPEMPAAPAAAPVDAAATTMPADRHSESLSAAGAECASTAGQPADAAQDASVASHGATTRPSLREAGYGVLTAWDTAGQTELAGSIDVLQAALALRRVAPGPAQHATTAGTLVDEEPAISGFAIELWPSGADGFWPTSRPST